jgi:hypothetical protein
VSFIPPSLTSTILRKIEKGALAKSREIDSELSQLFTSALNTIPTENVSSCTKHAAMSASAIIMRGGEELLFVRYELRFLIENVQRSMEELQAAMDTITDISPLSIGRKVSLKRKHTIMKRVLNDARECSGTVEGALEKSPELVAGCRIVPLAQEGL